MWARPSPPCSDSGAAYVTPVDVPVIETARLTLRAHRRNDFADCAAMWADPNIVRFISGKPSSRAETWTRMLRYAGFWQLLGFGYWAIEETATRRFVGELGFADYKRDLQPPLDGVPEFGWVIVTAAQGKGYATEAVRAAGAWGDENFERRATACIIDPDHVVSLRIAARAGYREWARTRYLGVPVVILTRET